MTDQELFQLLLRPAVDVLKKAYCPYSDFPVASSLITDEGGVFFGCNVENVSFPLTQCAEASAIGNMVSNNDGRNSIHAILVLAGKDDFCNPCGGCRQRLIEFSHSETRLFTTDGEIFKVARLLDLLPSAFAHKPLSASSH